MPFGADVAQVLGDHRRALRERWLALGIRPERELVFPDIDGGYRRPIEITKRFTKLVGDTGGPRVTFHSLRHSRETYLHDAGVPLHVIAAVMGHSPAMSLATYAHVDRDALAAVRALEDAEQAQRDVL